MRKCSENVLVFRWPNVGSWEVSQCGLINIGIFKTRISRNWLEWISDMVALSLKQHGVEDWKQMLLISSVFLPIFSVLCSVSSKENKMFVINLFVFAILSLLTSGVSTKSTEEVLTHGNTNSESHILRKYNQMIQTQTNNEQPEYFGSRRSRALPAPENNPCMNKL